MFPMFKLKIAFLLIFFGGSVLAQRGGVRGTVKNAQSGMYLPKVIVRLQEKNISTQTNNHGFFFLKKIPVGKYYLIFQKKGFYSLIIPDVRVLAHHIKRLSVEMYPGDEKEYLFLEIGGIEVTAQRELLPDEPETVHRISGGEIRHMQANSLADVLEMIPGNEKTGNLGLSKKQSVNLRNFGDQASAFGTKVVVDDVPLTNNADLQTGSGVGYGSTVPQTAGWQYDLRNVVAENIAKVEVMSGISGVEYGDNSAGVIVVKTKMRNIPNRIKIKNNPDTREANWMGGLHLWKTDFVYNFNYGYSERNIRISGDEYHRLSAALKASTSFFRKQVVLDQKFQYGRRLEENNYKIDSTVTRAYNRDYQLTYSQIWHWAPNKVSKIYWRNYIDFKNRNSWRHKMEHRDLGYITDRVSAGTREAIIADPVYFSDVTTTGKEWSFGSKLKISRKVFTGNILHRFLGGMEFQKDENTGPGKRFNILYPPNGSTLRPRSFDDIPGIVQLALFFEDRITGKWFLPFTLDAGFRIDSYNPESFKPFRLFQNKDVFQADQGTFFNPRFGLKLRPFKRTQLRFSYGKSSKAPGLSMLYPEAYYLDVVDSGRTTVRIEDGRGGYKDTVETIPLVSTYIFDQSSPFLKGYQSTKYEIGFDQQIGQVGLSILGYYQFTDKFPWSMTEPFIYHRYFWPHWPQEEGKEETESILDPGRKNKKAANLRWTKSSGLEFSLRTHRIPSLNMRFRVSAAFNFSKTGEHDFPLFVSTGHTYTRGDTLSSGWVVPRDMEILPFYNPSISWHQRTVINYLVDYIARPLGIWLTFKAQQVLWDQSLLTANKEHIRQAKGYYEEGKIVRIDAETSTRMGLDRTLNTLNTEVDTSKPNNKWLFSIVASKSLFSGAEISLYVTNILNDPAYYINRYGTFTARNPDMFWGIAFSTRLDDFFKKK